MLTWVQNYIYWTCSHPIRTNPAVRRVAVRARVNDLSRAKSGLRFYSKESPRAGTIEDYRLWRAMGESGTSPTWAGYLASISAEKAMAFQDTLDSGLYRDPAKYATGWSQASCVEQAAAYKSFLIEPLPLRIGPRSKAKRYVFSQRERNADEHLHPEIREVSMGSLLLLQGTKISRRMTNGSTSLARATLQSPNGRRRRWKSMAQRCSSSNHFHCRHWHSQPSERFATFIPQTGPDMSHYHSRMPRK